MIRSPLNRHTFFSSFALHNKKILEIGPYAKPQFRRPQYDVEYVDVFDADTIRSECVKFDLNPSDVPDKIDYVVNPSSRPSFQTNKKFDVIYSSHNIEHQPDLINHLCEMGNIVQGSGCRYYLCIPDKRYCFDHFQRITILPEILEAFIEQRSRHKYSTLIENSLYESHNDSRRHWVKDHGNNPHAEITKEKILKAIDLAKSIKDGYIDSHVWRFVPDSFYTLLTQLNQAQLQPWRVEMVSDTESGSNEFYAVLVRE